MERILLCKPKMCGREIDFIRAALAEDWAVPLGPDCDAFEHELRIPDIVAEPIKQLGIQLPPDNLIEVIAPVKWRCLLLD